MHQNLAAKLQKKINEIRTTYGLATFTVFCSVVIWKQEPDDKNTDRATIDVKVFKVCTIEFIIQLIALVLWTIPQNPQIDTRGPLWLFADFMTCQDRCRRHRCQHPYVVSNISARLFLDVGTKTQGQKN